LVVVAVSFVVLTVVPLEVTSFHQSMHSLWVECPVHQFRCAHASEFDVGGDAYAVLSGVWATNFTHLGSSVLVTINNGPSSAGCSTCAQSLYNSTGSEAFLGPLHSWSGSFRVTGVGPFHISVVVTPGEGETTTFQGNVDAVVL
jgi:hypothetical protein